VNHLFMSIGWSRQRYLLPLEWIQAGHSTDLMHWQLCENSIRIHWSPTWRRSYVSICCWKHLCSGRKSLGYPLLL